MSSETLEAKVEEIKKILLGNGKMGLVAKVQMLWESKKTSQGLLDWVFRMVIVTLIGFVAMKVGLK